jgi:hypothetical protein
MSRLHGLLRVARARARNAQPDTAPAQLAEQRECNDDHPVAHSLAQLDLQQPRNEPERDGHDGNGRQQSLREAFDIVMNAFMCTPDEADEAWALALANPSMAERAFHGDAAMIRAGWRPVRGRR